jgi:hypothetical protein
MPQVAGIVLERNPKGLPHFVRIDLFKHKEILPFLEEKGVLVNVPNDITKKAIHDANIGKVTKCKDISDFYSKLL